MIPGWHFISVLGTPSHLCKQGYRLNRRMLPIISQLEGRKCPYSILIQPQTTKLWPGNKCGTDRQRGDYIFREAQKTDQNKVEKNSKPYLGTIRRPKIIDQTSQRA